MGLSRFTTLPKRFLDRTPKTQSINEQIDKQDFIKIANLCSSKNSVKRMKIHARDWEKIFANMISSCMQNI